MSMNPTRQWPDAWDGLQCYSPKCAKPVTASFSCGNETLTTKDF